MDDELDDKQIKNKYSFLYPLVGETDFNIKISQQRQFWDTHYPVKAKHDVIKYGDFICNEKEFELMPHQAFVRNFLSSQTPYNSLLLYHGLGTGKTCSAISVAEMHRKYQKQTNSKSKIWIVSSPNVQLNFKMQLFDHRKLKKVNGVWNLKACTGNSYLNEINPMNIKNLSQALIIREVNKIIKSSYNFIGYTEFSNLIEKIIKSIKGDKNQNKILKKKFSDSLIIIDEVHNIRHSSDNPQKKVAINLLKVVVNAINLKLLFLSATPMYNNREEIIWLLNIMNINDNRGGIEKAQIFNKDGSLNKENLIAKSIGYISYIRGENPYTFPYRIWPATFKKSHSLIVHEEKSKKTKRGRFYPLTQINGAIIPEPIEHLDLFMVMLHSYQADGYKMVVNEIKRKMPAVQSEKAGLGYEALGDAIQTLNFVYPAVAPVKNVSHLYGKEGLKRIMKFNKKKQNFNYRSSAKKRWGRIFSQEHLHKYSTKIANIIKTIQKSKGIILIYSRYLDAGCVPIALALEEMGITRYGRKSLFATPPHPPVSYTLKERKEGEAFIPAKYALISGDINLSPHKNKTEIKAITDENNINGEIVKIIIITKAGAEGLDFKNIRQVHILEPWYNLNRSEQVIGRAIRNCSHKNLPFIERNVEIYLYGTMLDNINEEECADLYIYRKAEIKAKKIGEISRILKKNAVDCILNSPYNNLSIDEKYRQRLSSKKSMILFNIKSKPYSALCDYMEKCDYKCEPFKKITERDINDDTYNEDFIVMNLDKIIYRIRMLMKEQFIYTREELIARIRAIKYYPLMQINSALSRLVNDKNEYISDMFGRLGHLVNIGFYYMFQPLEINDEHIPRYERAHPIAYKRGELSIKIPPPSSTQVRHDIIAQLDDIYLCATTGRSCFDPWATQMSAVFNILTKPPFNIEEQDMEILICAHIFDSLHFQDKLIILNFIWQNDKLDAFYHLMKEVIEADFIVKGGKHDIVPFIQNIPHSKKMKKDIYILKGNTWGSASGIEELVKGGYQKIIEHRYKKDNLNNIFGFMSTDKNNNIKFKIINTTYRSKRAGKGFQCITQQKSKTQNLLNQLMHESPIDTWRDIKFVSVPTGNINDIQIKRGFSRSKLCNIEEMLLRFYESQDTDKTWFLSSFGTQYNKIEK